MNLPAWVFFGLVLNQFIATCTFVGFYRLSDWRSTAVGRHLMFFSVAFGSVDAAWLVLFAIRRTSLIWLLFAAMFGLGVLAWRRVQLVVRAQREDATADEELTAPSDDHEEKLTMSYLDPSEPQESEPILWRALIVAIVTAGIDAAVAFGAHISGSQESKIIAVVNLAAIGVAAFWARRKTFSPASVSRILRAKSVGRPHGAP